MGNAVTNWVFRRSKFCCCLPVRLGAAILSALSGLFSGFLTIVLWYEVSRNYFMSGGEKAAFVVAGLVYTFLFIASFLGFIGTCARKYLFLAIYAGFLYFHFLLSLIVAIYFLVQITHGANSDIVKLCQDGLRNSVSKSQCTGLLNITKEVYWAITIIVLALEIYCALVVTRYVNNLRYEKREKRQRRREHRQSAYDAYHKHMSSLAEVGEVDEERLLSEEFDPYDDGPFKNTPVTSDGREGRANIGLSPAEVVFETGSASEIHEMLPTNNMQNTEREASPKP